MTEMDIVTSAERAVQGKVVGVIIPPPEIRAIVDKTAQFVAKNGKSFEQRILSSNEGKTAKFNFMKEFDPYHAYYELKIREAEEAISGGRDPSAPVAPQPVVEQPKPIEVQTPHPNSLQKSSIVASSAKAAIVNPIARIAKNPPETAPSHLEFLIQHPSGVSAVDIDIIKMTAQYTAVNGKDFLANIALKEQRNPLFDFLKPTHMLFSFFTSLVDSYAKIVHATTDHLIRVEEKTNFDKALELSVQRWAYQRAEEHRKQEENDQNNAETMAYKAVDWNDFVVVEVIDFADDELLDIPGISGLNLANPSLPPSSSTPSHPAIQLPPPPPKLPSILPPPPPMAPSAPSAPARMEVEEDDDIKVVSNYQPRIAGSQVSNNGSMMTVDPVTGKPIRLDQLEEHMRIQLLDPKWREQQQRFSDKQKETGYAEGSSIADSLKLFAKKRGDIFGQGTGAGPHSAATIAEEEELEKRKYQDNSQTQWDGYYASMNTIQQIKSNAPAAPEPSLPSNAPTVSLPPPPPTPSFYATQIAPSIPVAPAAPPMMPQMMPGMMPQIVQGFPPAPYGYPQAYQQSFQPPPMPHPNMMQPAQPTDESKAKKPRLEETTLISAEEFASQYPGSYNLEIMVASDPSSSHWNFNGQSISLQISSVQLTIKDLKELLSVSYLNNITIGKLQLKHVNLGFVKDVNTLASLNLGPGSVLEASVKSRGGKR